MSDVLVDVTTNTIEVSFTSDELTIDVTPSPSIDVEVIGDTINVDVTPGPAITIDLSPNVMSVDILPSPSVEVVISNAPGPQGTQGPQGPQGSQGPAGLNGTNGVYIYNQILAASTWYINHNLQSFPSVSVIDTAGSVVVGAVQYIDSNNIVLTFSPIFSGTAYLN